MTAAMLPDTVSALLERMAAEFRCSICLSTLRDPCATPCQHVFCNECISMALRTQEKCPLCKGKVTRRALTPATGTNALLQAYVRLVRAYERETGEELPSQLFSQSALSSTLSMEGEFPWSEDTVPLSSTDNCFGEKMLAIKDLDDDEEEVAIELARPAHVASVDALDVLAEVAVSAAPVMANVGDTGSASAATVRLSTPVNEPTAESAVRPLEERLDSDATTLDDATWEGEEASRQIVTDAAPGLPEGNEAETVPLPCTTTPAENAEMDQKPDERPAMRTPQTQSRIRRYSQGTPSHRASPSVLRIVHGTRILVPDSQASLTQMSSPGLSASQLDADTQTIQYLEGIMPPIDTEVQRVEADAEALPSSALNRPDSPLNRRRAGWPTDVFTRD
ncbi:hypothetical protein THASP1DRAFT_27424 [Thamnocephalis sphaerospora]|uniref:RING-type domain-containing protein n=1 Tax=Thamnocephalis sphaerospora TaxID=78915 RepID=A0A4P9XWU1_9FUNG|nr:hypothetical protein THASP1DRAFT_27424 [Thamnocephalis sphaerospora]|eukprot:RKP10828.1 hypothetical protein THASP1DRAFT_27424 [Thamnocephalis sphaerospora]